LQNILKEGPIGIGIFAEENHVCAGDHGMCPPQLIVAQFGVGAGERLSASGGGEKLGRRESFKLSRANEG
jgi:hypothetical protein